MSKKSLVRKLSRSLMTLGFLALALNFADNRAGASNAPILIELYTSQGCSSCPPADRFAGKLIKERKDLIVLSLPVDYWDRLGWKDTLASPRFSARQRHYARKMRWGVYTPQMVVDGQHHGVGSRPSAMLRIIRDHKKSRNVKTQVKLQRHGSFIDLRIAAAKNIERPAMIWRVNFIQKRVVDIGAGENSGRRVAYYNVVKEMVALDRWSGAAVQRRLAVHKDKNYDGVAVFIQEAKYGAVLASAGLTLNR